MQVVTTTPFRVASLLWQPHAGSFAFTVLCKATFQLRPGESPLAAEQEVLQKEDGHWGNDPLRSLCWASDLAPRKSRADVVLIGHAFAPGRQPVRSLVARLAVGEVDKSIEVLGQRYLDSMGFLREGPLSAKLPLAYERAAAGPQNPAGLRPGARDAQGRIELPSLVPPGQRGVSPDDVIAPIGFGPIAATWPLRLEKLGRHAAGWNHSKWYRQPLDGDIDMSYFNFAPPDQQPPSLREDERIVLENLHPEHPVFITCLPGIRPIATVELAGKAGYPLALRCDTLSINTDSLTCSLVWRGHFPVDDPRVEGRVVITMDSPSGAVAAGGPDVMLQTALPSVSPDGSPEEALPFQAGVPGTAPAILSMPAPSRRAARSGETTSLPAFGTPLAPTASMPAAPVSMPVPAVVEPPPPEAPPVKLSIGQALAAAQASAQAAAQAPSTTYDRGVQIGGLRAPEMMAALSTDDGGGQSRLIADIGAGGVLAASNAAVPPPMDTFGASLDRGEPMSGRPSPALDGQEVVRLAWFNLEGVPRIRRKREFLPILEALEKRPIDRDADDPKLDESPAEIEDRREVLEILLRGLAVDAEGVRGAVNDGIRDDGRFVPSVVLLAGELEMTFDALETLKAVLPVAASFAAPDDALTAVVQGASTFLGTPGYPSPLVADTLVARLRSAFLQTRKNLKASALEGPAERVLVERRLYRRRAVFGDTFVRAQLHLQGSPYAIPVYFPETAAKKLPLQRRFKVRLLAETHLAADPAESHPAALLAMALAEVLPGGRR